MFMKYALDGKTNLFLYLKELDQLSLILKRKKIQTLKYETIKNKKLIKVYVGKIFTLLPETLASFVTHFL